MPCRFTPFPAWSQSTPAIIGAGSTESDARSLFTKSCMDSPAHERAPLRSVKHCGKLPKPCHPLVEAIARLFGTDAHSASDAPAQPETSLDLRSGL